MTDTDTSKVTEPPKTPVEIALASIGLPAQPPVPATKRTLTSEGFSMLYAPATWAQVSPMLVSVNHLSSTRNHNFHATAWWRRRRCKRSRRARSA